jgi:hypothetical protein
MTPSPYTTRIQYKVLFFKITLLVFLVLFPVLVGSSNSGIVTVEPPSKNFEINYYSLNQIFLDIDSRYDHSSRPKGTKNQKASVNLLTVVHVEYNTPAHKQNSLYYPAEPEYPSQYIFKAKVLLLDMPPPSEPV